MPVFNSPNAFSNPFAVDVELAVDVALRERLIQAAVTDRLQRIAALGDDTYADRSVIRWAYRFEGSETVYTYAAIKVADRWHTTGATSQSVTWAELAAFIAKSDGPAVAIEILAGVDTVTAAPSA